MNGQKQTENQLDVFYQNMTQLDSLYETHLRSEDTHRLKVSQQKKDNLAKGNQKSWDDYMTIIRQNRQSKKKKSERERETKSRIHFLLKHTQNILRDKAHISHKTNLKI